MVEFFKATNNIPVCGRLIQCGENRRNLMQKLHLSMRQIHGTSAYWYTSYIQLLAMVRSLGPPTWYLTFSCNDLHWVNVLKALLRADNKENVSVDDLSFQEKMRLVKKYPIIVARHFMRRVNALMKILKSENIFGAPVIDFWWRIEFQLRGSPHVHMVVWCPDTPKFDTPEGIRLIDEVMSCCSTTEDPTLNDLVNRLQRPQTYRHLLQKDINGSENLQIWFSA